MGVHIILIEFDFYIYYQKDYSPEFRYGMFSLSIHFIVQYFIIFYGNKRCSYQKLLLVTFLMLISLFITLPLIVAYIPRLMGFLITCVVIIILGAITGVNQSAIYGVISILPSKYILVMSFGQGICGLILNLIKYISLFAFESIYKLPNNKKKVVLLEEIYIFYGCAIINLIMINISKNM